MGLQRIMEDTKNDEFGSRHGQSLLGEIVQDHSKAQDSQLLSQDSIIKQQC
jgi:hypothetical protein